MFEVNVSSEFEAAHRLMNYRGKQRQIHGHSWSVGLSVYRPRADSTRALGHTKFTPESMLIDPVVLQRYLEDCTIDFDNALILNAIDPLASYLSRFKETMRIIQLPSKYGDPTPEAIALYVYEALSTTDLQSKYLVKIRMVKVVETAHSFCIFKPE